MPRWEKGGGDHWTQPLSSPWTLRALWGEPSGGVRVATLSPHPPPPSAPSVYTITSRPQHPHRGCQLTHLLNDPDHPAAPQLLQGRAQCAYGPEPQAAETLGGWGGRQTTQPQGPTPLRHCLLWPSSRCKGGWGGKGQSQGTSSCPGGRELAHTCPGRPHHTPHPAPASPPPSAREFSDFRNPALEVPSTGGRRSQGGGENLGTCGLRDTPREPRHAAQAPTRGKSSRIGCRREKYIYNSAMYLSKKIQVDPRSSNLSRSRVSCTQCNPFKLK